MSDNDHSDNDSINEDDNSSLSEKELLNSQTHEPAIYGNGISGNDWLKDYNKEYPIKIGEKDYPTLEHYLQYRRFCYTVGTKDHEEFYAEIISRNFSSYYELINYTKEKIPHYKGSIKALQGIYDLLYDDYIFARLTKALTYKDISDYLHKMEKENITPKEIAHCNIDSLEDEEIELLKVTLMHIHCNNSSSVHGSKKDPWTTVCKVITKHTNLKQSL